MEITLGERSKDCLAVLKLTYPFTPTEISQAFKRKLKEVHPDVSKDKFATEKTREIIEAYKHLKNLAMENNGYQAKDFDERDLDIFTLWEVCPECKGKKVKVIYQTKGACHDCLDFSGFFSFFGGFVGRGYVYTQCKKCSGIGKFKIKGICSNCQGRGKVKIRCKSCGGTGMLKEEIKSILCSKCGGKGKIELNPFNPVIPKGAVLGT